MRLAERFGEPDVDAFMERISPEQFVEWGWYYELESEAAEKQGMADDVRRRMEARTRGVG